MKTCVPEYKDCTIPEIIGYIEPNPQVGQVGLHPDETNPPKIQGMSTESTTTTEERVVYDVRFSAVAPGEDGKIGLIINIEAQSKYHPGYPLVKRAIYYCGRMLSAQYGSVFTQSHYGEIQKVYSIWICTRPPKERGKYHHQLHPPGAAPGGPCDRAGQELRPDERHHDLPGKTGGQTLRRSPANAGGAVHRTICRQEVIQILEDEYEFAHAHTMERTVSEMCNLSQGIFEEGMEKGMAQGMEKGIERGTNRERLQNIRSLMETTGWPAEQVMTAMKIPAADQPKYLKLLSLPQ
ncbi:MAG: hypothetical protein ACLSHU_06575 [Oscillospiraceae bacterium]